jgi:hypothetical protein
VVAKRLVTSVEVDDTDGSDVVSVLVRQELELTDGRRVLLLDDRGWGSTATWASSSTDEIVHTTVAAVGPDEPFEDHTADDMAADHWRALAQAAGRRGVNVGPAVLRQLRHDVVLSERLLSRLEAREAPD